MSEARDLNNWSLVCHTAAEDEGRLAVVTPSDGGLQVTAVRTTGGAGGDYPPVFLGAARDGRVILLEPASKHVLVNDALPVDAVPAYAYRDPDGTSLWFMNDGDEQTGCDALNCGSDGASVTVIRNTGNAAPPAQYVKTICVGRGHHVTTFTAPSRSAPRVPRCAYVSNLMEGTISVIGTDPDDPDGYLKVTTVINLHDPKRDQQTGAAVPNNAFPHGKVFSPLTGKVYSLNNGYGTVNVIDPITHGIEATIPMPVSSNLLLSPDGRFVIGKGADRKSDPDHVIGRLTVMDAVSGQMSGTVDLPDFYPSTYRFNADGSKLYVTSAATGKGAQRERLKTRVIMVFDTRALPALKLIKEIVVGPADCGRRPLAFARPAGCSPLVFIPNPSDGTLSVLDGGSDSVIHTITVDDRPVTEFNFSFWDGTVTGA